MRNKIKTRIHKIIYERIIYNNKMSPFPLVDTEEVEILRNKIENNNINYDAEPVVCCGHCKSLYLVQDNCFKCRTSGGELEVFSDIFKYLEEYGSIWDLNEGEDEQKTSSN